MLPTEGFEAAQAVGRTGFAPQEGQQLLDELAQAALAVTDEADDVGLAPQLFEHSLQGIALQNLSVVGIAIPKRQDTCFLSFFHNLLSHKLLSGTPSLLA